MKEMTTQLLTPENIQNQQFHVRFRGFDVEEVDAFLEKVAENYLVLVKENEKLKEELDAIQVERDQIQTQERTFKNAIISAQTIADEMQAKAKQEAHVLKENARLEAQTMLDEATRQESQLKEQISSLLLEKAKLKEELCGFLEAHMERINSQYGEDMPAPEAAEPQPSRSAAASSTAPDPGPTDETTAEAAAEEEPPAAPDEEHPLFEEAPTHEDEDDAALADLYEKIDLSELDEEGRLTDQEEASTESEPEPPKKAADFSVEENELDDLELSMPDLDGDMLFSLEDPLDKEPEPKVTIDPWQDKKDDRT
ncbi:MAG: hypothetical protein C0613_07545 [Desulfobulbaceae bacterium]|nr:MAG: hypothetical protein C0613_07545 [Desulfobulbaceae bacterium]